MKADARTDPGDGPERDELRETLQLWKAPAAPAELEDSLRREFRGRRPRRQAVLWVALAAGLVLLAAWPLIAPRLERRPAAMPVPSASAMTATAAPLALKAPPPGLQPAEAPRAALAVGRPVADQRPARRKPKEPAVVVEPRQAELLAELGRRGWERTEAGPGASLPNMPAAEAPAYGAEWEEVTGEWPAVQVVVPRSGR